MHVLIASDLAGYQFKCKLLEALTKEGYDITDIGCHSSTEGEYPVYGKHAGEKVVSGEYERGIVICGSGHGITMAANKVNGIRAALCDNVYSAFLSREHNDANILGLSAWGLKVEDAVKIVEVWLFAKFAGGKHEKRVEMLKKIEDEQRLKSTSSPAHH